MKKALVVLLAMAMISSLCACDGENIGNSGGDTSVSENPTEVSASEQPSGNTTEGASKIEATLWTLEYDSTVWNYEEDDYSDSETLSKIVMTIPDKDSEDSLLVNAEIRVSIDEPYTFRDYLTSYGFDQYEYKVNNAYDFTDVGGVDCLKQEGNYWGEPCIRYFNRVEGAGATVFIEIIGDTEDERIDTLLSGLTFNLKDTGNVDAPWSWEGEPYSAEDHEKMVGTYTLKSKWTPIKDCIITDETFNHDVAVVGNKAYILSDGLLKQYSFDGKTLTFDKDITLDEEYDYIQAADDGSVWLSAFGSPLISVKDGKVTASYDGADSVAMHPSGTWGISWFSSPECEKVTISDSSITTTPITFSEVETIMHLMVDDNYIYVCGSAADSSGHNVFMYNKDGELQKTLTDGEGGGLGSITFMAETDNGFIGLDGNMRSVVLWTKDGKYIGEADDADIFGTSYPWFCSGAKLEDGSILTIMTEERADKSAMELVAYKLEGF